MTTTIQPSITTTTNEQPKQEAKPSTSKPMVQTTTLTVTSDELVTVSTRKKKEPKPSFTLISCGIQTKVFSSSEIIDGLAVFGQLSHKQQLIVLKLRDVMIRHQLAARNIGEKLTNPNKVIIPIDDRAEMKKLLRDNNNKKTLIERQLLRQIDKHSYMLNPFVFVPYEGFESVRELWHSLANSGLSDDQE